jgi:seryl-tRNA synthetase
MHDIRLIRETPEAFDAGLARRGLAPMSARVLELDGRRRGAQTELQELQTKRNESSKAIGEAKRRGEDASAQMAEVAALKETMAEAEESERSAAAELDALLSGLPNTPGLDVPDGPDESANVTLRAVGQAPGFNFEAKQHFDLGEALGLLDFETAAKLSGARFAVLRGTLARLHRAIANFMIDLHTEEHGYTEVAPPYLVRDAALYGTGQLPKFGEDLFRTTDDFWLIPTAEVPLTNLVAGDILEENALPLRVTALTPCFRSEAGAAGNVSRGMLRQHQFDKVEMVGFGARKTHDIEVWLPGQDTYREISSCSNCGDFQARRMNARFRPAQGKGTRFVHSLNGSGVAVGRALIAVMENYQRADGSIEIPEVLRPGMGGMREIGPQGEDG